MHGDGQRHEDLQALPHALHELVLARPGDRVAWGQRDLVAHHTLQILDVPANVPSGHVHVDVAGQHAVFVPNHRRARQDPQGGELGQWHLRASRCGDEDTSQLLGGVPQLARVAHVDRVAFSALDGRGNALPADGRFDDLPDVHHGQSIARDLVASDVEIQEIPPRHALGIDTPGAGHLLRHHLEVFADLLNLLQVRPEDFNAHRGPHPGCQHVDAGLDRHGPGIAHPRELQGFVHLGDQALIGQTRPPLRLGLELDHHLHHAERGGIG